MSYNEEVREAKSSRKKPTYVNGSGGPSPKFQFINVSPTKEEKALIKQWGEAITLVIDALNDVVNNRCNVSLKYNEKQDAFICSITDMHPTSRNFGMCVSSYAGLPERALFTTLWFVVEKWGGLQDWPKPRVTQDDW